MICAGYAFNPRFRRVSPTVELLACNDTQLTVQPSAVDSLSLGDILVGTLNALEVHGSSICTVITRQVLGIAEGAGCVIINTVSASLVDMFDILSEHSWHQLACCDFTISNERELIGWVRNGCPATSASLQR